MYPEPAGSALSAQELDVQHYQGLATYTAYVARTVFIHSLAYNEPLKGLSPEHLRFSMLCPSLDISFIEDARKRFLSESAYLDDRSGAPMRFLVEANLTQIIRRQEQHVDPGEARAQLNDLIKEIFKGQVFETISFPGGPFDVPDEVGDGRPRLIVMSYDGVSVGDTIAAVPDLIAKIVQRKGSDSSGYRALRNQLVFVVADDARKDEMRHKISRRLALFDLKKPERLAELAEHQQAKVRELEQKSQTDLALAIQQCYRHVFYPSRQKLGDGSVDLAHSAIDIQSTSDKPGSGQQQVIRALRELKKLRLSEDDPDSPTYIRDRTPLKKGEITTAALREEFRRDPGLPILVGDDVFVRGVRKGVESGEYVYRRGELLYGQGDPSATIVIDEQSFIYTMLYAKDKGIWPRPAPAPTPSGSLHGSGDPVPQPTGRSQTSSGSGTGTVPPPPPPPGSFTAEGVLKEALTLLWEQARSKNVEKIASLNIRLFDANDAFRLMGTIGAVPAAKKTVAITGGYETKDGATFEMEFHGSVADALPVKDFLDAQLRDAASRTMEAGFNISFDAGLLMSGDAAEKLTERMTRFASGAAYVTATAEAAK